MIKVLHIGAKNFPPAHGGTERVVYNIVNSIDEVDFYIMVEWDQPETDRIIKIPTGLNYFQRMIFIKNFYKEHSIDILHFHNEKYIPMAILLSIFCKVVLTVHGVHFRSPKFSYFNRVVFWVVDVLGTIFLRRMVHCSEWDSKAFSKYIFFRKTYFVNNGTNICESAQKESDIEFMDKYVYVGRITPAKNILTLIESAEKKGIKLDLYGQLDKDCEEYCNKAMKMVENSKFVSYKGVVPFDQVFEIMKKYKAFLYITIMEGLPLSVLEAASCGMYLILSDIPHHRYLRLPNVTYVDVKSPMIPFPSEITTGEENRKYILDNFTHKKMGEQYYSIYKSIL